MSRRFSHRKDANHDRLVTLLRLGGAYVLDTSQTGLGFDALVAKYGRLTPVEIKDGSLPPSRRILTPHEAQVHAELWRHGVRVEMLMEEADLEVLGRDQRARREG